MWEGRTGPYLLEGRISIYIMWNSSVRKILLLSQSSVQCGLTYFILYFGLKFVLDFFRETEPVGRMEVRIYLHI